MGLLTGLATIAQDLPVPEAVDQAFKVKFSNAKSIYWTQNSEQFIVEFEMGPEAYSAVFDKDGNWVETSRIIPDSEIPAAVINSVKKAYQGIIICYGEIVENAKRDKHYRIHGQLDNTEYKLDLTPEGKVLSVVEKEFFYKQNEA